MSAGIPSEHERKKLYERVFAIFEKACELAPEQQNGLLERECVGDAELWREVEALLKADSTADRLLDVPPTMDGAFSHSSPQLRALASRPDHIGRYRLIRSIGSGGMGDVYEAEQESPKRSVALKVMHPWASDAAGLTTRFVREGEIQAGLVHPGIAQVYESGVVQHAGRPIHFIAMELVRGVPLNAFVQARPLSPEGCIEFMLQLCGAVGFAHQRGVIHRDLKPANIFVCDTESGPTPKVLDFGVAKLTGADVRQVSMQTQAGQIIGTLAYMSPEQVLGQADDIDTRSDIYSLGLILFEMLTGRLPIDIRDASIPEAARRIANDSPTRLSTAHPSLRGDLETIVHKAIAKERAARYDSVSEFAADLRRYLNHEPIAARPPSAIYQFGKFARRNRGLVTAGAALLVTLVVGVIALTLLTISANKARDIAERKTAVSEGVSQVLLNALTQVTPKGSLGKEPLVIDTVRKIESQVDDPNSPANSNNPEVQAVVYNILGIIHRERGDLDHAETVFTKALDIRRRVLDPGDPNLADSLNNMGLLRRRQGRHADAAAYYEQAVALQRVSSFRDDARLARNIYNLASAHVAAGEFAKAKPLIEESVAMHEAQPTVSQELLAMHVSLKARIALGEMRLPEAKELAERALAMQRDAVGPAHPTIVLCLDDLGNVALEQGNNETAITLLREGEAMALMLFPTPDHPTVRTIRTRLLNALNAAGRSDEAMALEQAMGNGK